MFELSLLEETATFEGSLLSGGGGTLLSGFNRKAKKYVTFGEPLLSEGPLLSERPLLSEFYGINNYCYYHYQKGRGGEG